MRLVQLAHNGTRRIAKVDGDTLHLLDSRLPHVYSLALHVMNIRTNLASAVRGALTSETILYDPIYWGASEWHLLPPFDHPTDPAHCLISGTGLTHKASAENRAAMHKETNASLTDSAKMYQLGLEAGNPPAGQIGVQPEWFYKGDGSILCAHNEPLSIPSYAWDGGEEPEIAGVYLVSETGMPYRVGFVIGNEFSDHRMEKKNYLYLAPSKLRNCSIGPELFISETSFDHVPGVVSIVRNGSVLWTKQILSGQKNMSHSLANLEHHHFKYGAHRRPGDVHVHFFGADAFSFGDDIALQSGDIMEVAFSQFGRALRNPLTIEPKPEPLITVWPL
jgi:hypothetical protein